MIGSSAKFAMMLEAGGVGAVLGALRDHPPDPKLQKEGFQALCELAGGAGGPEAIVGGGGVGLLTAGLTAHPAASGVQHWGCYAVMNLASKDGAAAGALAEGGVVEAVAAALHTHAQPGGDCGVADAAVTALKRVAEKGG
eukprot:COSAG04_NODE_19405_length_417_cov_0.632075_1_plen_139_part_11